MKGMSLADYLGSLPKGGRAQFAAAIGVAPAYLYQIEHGIRKAGADLAIAIERESGGKVTCESLRPDIDWAYLRGTKRKAAA
jgi:DNA-binding transcriptional regulator YdaS (Cro superfamily)